MTFFLLRRVTEGVATLIAASMLTFAAGYFTGDPAKLLVSLESTRPLQASEIRRELGLDQPLWRQYLIFVSDAARGDFGRSFRTSQPVSETLERRITPSVKLALVAVGTALAIALPLGVVAGVRRGSWLDALARGVALLGQAMPSFWLGLILVAVFAVQFRLLPSGGDGDWRHYVLPAFTIACLITSGIVRLLRSAMIDAMNSDYVRFARSYGMEEWRVVWVWALRNALVPVVTFVGFMFSIIIAGAVVVEVVFAWPGLGRLSYESVLARDFPMLRGAVLVWAALVVAASFLTDVAYAFLDPRTRS